jgi:hypothetical protein
MADPFKPGYFEIGSLRFCRVQEIGPRIWLFEYAFLCDFADYRERLENGDCDE